MPFGAIGRLFKTIGKGFVRVFKATEKAGLNDAMLEVAKRHVREVELITADNTARANYVVRKLQEEFGIPERFARYLTESAVILWRDLQAAQGDTGDEVDADVESLVREADA